MGSVLRKVAAIAKAAVLGFLILIVGAGIWSALVAFNLSRTPGIPWSVPAMAVVLWLMWRYMGGRYWPRSTSEARRLCLRASMVPARQFAWAFVAGTFAVLALAGIWIVLFQLVRMPGNALPDLSRYPSIAVVPMILMASLAAPLTEEPAFRGYCQAILEREFPGPVAVAISSMFFALAHGPSQGFEWPKLLFYLLVGLVFGTTAYLTGSILPAIPGHFLGLVIFFTLIWPHDAARHLIAADGADIWFWLHIAQAAGFGALAVWALVRLAGISRSTTGSQAPAIRPAA